MADNVPITAGTGTDIATDDVAGVHFQKVKVDVGGDGASSPWTGTVTANLAAGTNNVGDVDVLTVPADPFGANADAAATAGSTGSIQAKLRLVTSQLDAIKTAVETLDNTVGGSELQVDIVTAPTLTVNSHAVTNAGTFAVQPGPATSGGLTTFMASSSDGSTALTSTKQTIKASAGQLYGWTIFNPNTSTVWVHVYNTDTVTVGTTNPQLTLAIPATSAAHVLGAVGIAFSTAMSTAATSTAGGNGAPTTALDTVWFYA